MKPNIEFVCNPFSKLKIIFFTSMKYRRHTMKNFFTTKIY